MSQSSHRKRQETKAVASPGAPSSTHPLKERDALRLRWATSPEAMSVELVSAIAGDRKMTEDEKVVVHQQKLARGGLFYSDLLFSVSHHYFAPEIAKKLWGRILSHKRRISKRLRRNVRIAVAALDYLSNIRSESMSLTLISESYVTEMADLSMRDGMTGLFNHTSCYELLDLECIAYRRYGLGVAVLLLDIDGFKGVNDRHGHQVGDRILIETANTLLRVARDSDICCRFGGDEFVVILRLTNDPEEALALATRIRSEAARITAGGRPISVSVGVAVCAENAGTSRTLIEQADRSLYEAKRTGRRAADGR